MSQHFSDNIQLNVLSYKSFGDPEQRISPPGDDIAVLRLHWSSPVKHPKLTVFET